METPGYVQSMSPAPGVPSQAVPGGMVMNLAMAHHANMVNMQVNSAIRGTNLAPGGQFNSQSHAAWFSRYAPYFAQFPNLAQSWNRMAWPSAHSSTPLTHSPANFHGTPSVHTPNYDVSAGRLMSNPNAHMPNFLAAQRAAPSFMPNGSLCSWAGTQTFAATSNYASYDTPGVSAGTEIKMEPMTKLESCVGAGSSVTPGPLNRKQIKVEPLDLSSALGPNDTTKDAAGAMNLKEFEQESKQTSACVRISENGAIAKSAEDFNSEDLQKSYNCPCDICNKTFASEASMTKHKKIHKPLPPYKCFTCGKRFTRCDGLNNHLMTHGSEGMLNERKGPFAYCEIDPENAENLNPENSVFCVVCNKGFRYRESLTRHLKTHYEEKPHQCYICDRRFGRSDLLKKHWKTHGLGDKDGSVHTSWIQRTYACEICGKSYRGQGVLAAHMKIHDDDPSLTCSVCGEVFVFQSGLNKHMETHNRVEKPKEYHICHICGKRCVDMTSHMFTHADHKPHKCDECGKEFVTKSRLNAHMPMHSDERPHSCDVCGKAFRKKCRLRDHQKIHSGVKPYVCTVCQKAFMDPTYLKNHMVVHSGVRPFICEVCGKGFTQRVNMTVHMRLHTGEKPFSCHLCDKTFRVKCLLTAHVKGHSGMKMYECDICGKGFKNGRVLREHALTHSDSSETNCTEEDSPNIPECEA